MSIVNPYMHKRINGVWEAGYRAGIAGLKCLPPCIGLPAVTAWCNGWRAGSMAAQQKQGGGQQ